MTDSNDPKAPKNSRNSRRKPSREPATIDLKATVIDEGSQQDKAWDAVKPEETIVPEPETKPEATAEADTVAGADTISASDTIPASDTIAGTETIAASEEILDSGTKAESVESGAATDELPPREEEPRPAPPPSAPVVERRTSPIALVGAGLLGGLVGAGLVYGLQASQQPPAPQDDPRIAQLEQRVSALGQSQGAAPDLSNIEERLVALEATRGSLDQRLEEIQNTANAAASRAEEALNRPLPEAAAPPQNDAALTDLTNRTTEFSTRLEEVSSRLEEFSGRLGTLEQTARTLEGEVRTGAQSATEAASAVQELTRRLGEQDQRLAALTEQAAENSKSVEASYTGTRVVLAERLDSALRGGAPFADVLDALRKSGVEAERIAALEPFAEKGAPTASVMRERFEPLEAQILRDQRAASGEWSDRVLRMLDKVVTVRPVNEPGEAGVPATLAQIRQALASGDMEGAATAWSSLPEPARRISEAWGQEATALAQAERASREISTEALAALNRSTQ